MTSLASQSFGDVAAALGSTTARKGQIFFFPGRVLVWFSCGAASAVAAKFALEKHPAAEVLYCEVVNEHPDNERFLRDVENWLGVTVKRLRSTTYPTADIFDTFHGYIVGVHGAQCTRELKRKVRIDYQWPEDTHVFGFTADEKDRIRDFEKNNPALYCEWLLADAGVTKRDCYGMIQAAGIVLPMMYRLGYRNNNCIGCVKGGAGYWNKIRRDFPEHFERMAAHSRALGVRLMKVKGQRIFLDELPPGAGRYDEEPDFDCGPQCVIPVDREDALDGKLTELLNNQDEHRN